MKSFSRLQKLALLFVLVIMPGAFAMEKLKSRISPKHIDHIAQQRQKGTFYEIIDKRAVYQWTLSDRDKDRLKLTFAEQNKEPFVGGPWALNYIARREPCFIVSGDLPRFALARVFEDPILVNNTPALPGTDPLLAAMGHLRISCEIDGKQFWLDEAKAIQTRFYPWGTIHKVTVGQKPAIDFEIKAVLAENTGLAVEVTASATKAVKAQLNFYYGGFGFTKGHQTVTAYLQIDPKASENDQVRLTETGAAFLDPGMPVKVLLQAQPKGLIELTDIDEQSQISKGIVMRHTFKANPDGQTFRILVSQTDSEHTNHLQIEKFEKYIQLSEQYYEKMLESFEIETPDEIIDTAFYSSIINMDYTYHAPAWLEGIHHWNTYFTDNYQISAAVNLGQFQRARDALIFLANAEGGPGCLVLINGSVSKNHSVGRRAIGFPYYPLQLYRYWKATGDMETLDRVWKQTVENMDYLLKTRDPEENLVLNYFTKSNLFIFQADHLGFPGDSFTPTIMMANDLLLMAEMAEARGENDSAARWRHQAEYMQRECVRRLWSPQDGKFTGTIDNQGLSMKANYYTDFVFPQLYSTIPSELSWISLRTLDDTLWVGDDLIRVGNYYPDCFGNNNVMGTQTAEAAEAYFGAGRLDEGKRLLHGTALGATVYTNSPGSFPERMSDTGFGLPDYTFGHPTAAYLRAVVGGLFGFERISIDKPLIWKPAIPADWKNAKLRLGGITMSSSGTHGDRTYTLALDKPQAAQIRVPLLGSAVEKLTDERGRPVQFTIEAHPGGGFMHVKLPAANKHVLQLRCKAKSKDLDLPSQVVPGGMVTWSLPAESMSVKDPQKVFETFRIDGTTLKAKLTNSQGMKTFFLADGQNQRILPVELMVGKPAPDKKAAPVSKGKRQHINMEKHFNSDFIRGRNIWHGGKLKFDFSKYLVEDSSAGNFKIGDYTFKVKPSGENMVVLRIGDNNLDTLKLELEDKPFRLLLDVSKSIKSIELLTTSEAWVRLTGMQIGRMNLHYSDGLVQTEPLVYGENIDCAMRPFAEAVVAYKIDWINHVSAFNVQADPSRVLESVEFELFTTDISMGIFAINLVMP